MPSRLDFLSDRLTAWTAARSSAYSPRMAAVDVLTDVLAVARVDSTLMATFDAAAPWGIELPARRGASFHAIVAGTCWFGTGSGPLRQLVPGDLVLLPTGERHVLTAEPGLALRPFDESLKRELIDPSGELVLDGPGVRTRILCAGYDYDTAVAHPVLGLLPTVLHVSTAQPEVGPALRGVLDLLAAETSRPDPGRPRIGSATAAARLLDLLLVHVLRAWLAGHCRLPSADAAHSVNASDGDGARPSLLRGLNDPVTGRALAALHADPARAWTLESLAREVDVSRATLARRFTRDVGDPPLAYLAQWRMKLAAWRLRQTDDAVARVAEQVGYSSEFAFNRAFSRAHGQPPGRYRRSGDRLTPSATDGASSA